MTFDEAVKARALSVADLVVRKQRDYGPNNIMRNHVRPELALAVRLSDKIARVVNLAEKGTDPSNEALQDTWMDIVGYGLIGLMVLNGEFELPLEKRAEEEPGYIIKFTEPLSSDDLARRVIRAINVYLARGGRSAP